MAKRSRDQLSLFSALGLPEEKLRTEDHLAKPLTREEQRAFGKLYVENIGLIKFFANKLTRKYGYCMATEDINSCVDFAAIKAFRAWKPERGKLSTILWSFALGECLHFLRSSNWGIKAPHKVRELGNAARKLVDQGLSPEAICATLGCDREQLKEALVATAGIAHDVKGFDLHYSHYPTPMDWLERQEELAMAASCNQTFSGSMAGTYFAALDVRFWVKLGTTASTAPTTSSTMTEVLSLTNTSISVSSDTQTVLDYSTDFGFTSQLVTGNSYTITCALNLDPTSDGYLTLKRAAQTSANNVAVQWFRELPLVGSSNDNPQVDAGVAFVSNWSESLEAGSVASVSFDLLGYGAPKNYRQGDPVATLTITDGGSGLTAGTGVALVSTSPAQGNGSGRNATATITVNGSGVIQTATIVAGGQGYKVGDVLTMSDGAVVGSGDTAPVLTVATVS